ncbi:hypothetical protein [Polaromonas sp. CG_23.6]|uniref:hypothetical protein n=1 Tax=Polaromonas sp. CG_23.6 TaxID=2760709 RepID=UPI0024760CB3|nr:hypothetical protein [Polaromonas sp. CG_23.6]MDH6185481.1 hypothetical protein [Polaromonas sp. CG_23.6]
MTLLSKSAILGAHDLKHEDVNVPAWGGTVRVRAMTGQERDEFRTSISTEEGGVPVGKFAAALLVATLTDEAGARLFSAADIDALQKKSAASLDAPAAVAMRLNGLGGAAIAEAKNA